MLSLVFYLFFGINVFAFTGVSSIQQYLSIVERLSHVFCLDQQQIRRKEDVTYEQVGINLTKASFSWGFKKNAADVTNEDQPVLTGLNLAMGPADFLVVVGKIGAGKTSLLFSLMDETFKTAGDSEIHGKLAYVEQEPLIISASIKQNVAFGLKFDDDKFERAFRLSHLLSDLENFSNGADTVIGERGINISGG